jgi:hypothetical protein
MEYKLPYKDYVAAIKEGRLLGLKCNECGAYTVPPKKVCMECTSENLEVVELSGNGEIRTFTVVHVSPEGFAPPYVIGMAELDEGPWITGKIIGVDPDNATMENLIGKRVKVGHEIHSADKFSGGEMVALTFNLES